MKNIKGGEGMTKNITVKYDNSFNKTSLNVLTKVQTNVLLAVFSRMSESLRESSIEDDCVAQFSFSELRELTGSKNIKIEVIKKSLDAILDTKVEYFIDNNYTKANLFSDYTINEKGNAVITLTGNMKNKLIINNNQYTILMLDEYTSLKNMYAKELYRILRQFRHSGLAIKTKEDLLKVMRPPKSYDEYEFIRKALLPAIEENKQYFEDLTVNIDRNKLPGVVQFTFKKHERTKPKDLKQYKNMKEIEDEIELMEYLAQNGMV